MSLFSVENISTVPRRKLFTLWGVEFQATPWAWFSLVYPQLIGLVVSFVVLPNLDLGMRLLSALGFGVCILGAYYIHELGHLLSGHLVGSPMTVNLVTATTQINHYDEHVPVASWVHIGRAIGGPLANLGAFLIASLLISSAPNNVFLSIFSLTNGLLLFAILPVPSLDGAVIVRELRHWRA